MTWTLGSRSARSTNADSSSGVSAMIALPFSGRLNVIRATLPVTSYVMVFRLSKSTGLIACVTAGHPARRGRSSLDQRALDDRRQVRSHRQGAERPTPLAAESTGQEGLGHGRMPVAHQ